MTLGLRPYDPAALYRLAHVNLREVTSGCSPRSVQGAKIGNDTRPDGGPLARMAQIAGKQPKRLLRRQSLIRVENSTMARTPRYRGLHCRPGIGIPERRVRPAGQGDTGIQPRPQSI